MAHEAAANTDERVVRHPRDPAAGVAPGRRAPAPETLRLYKTDWRAFEAWCAAAGFSALPASPATVAGFVTEASARLGAGALARRAAAIAAQHRQNGIASPTDDPVVRALLSAARSGATPRRIPPPKPPVLLRMAAACPGDRAGVRDRALLLLAAAGLGRAALVGLDAEDLRFMPDAVDLIVRQGPGRRGGAGGHGDAAGLGSADTDGEAHGRGGADRLVIVARGINRNLCAVQALRDWLETSDTLFGPVFRKIDRWGNIEQTRLGTDAIRRILTRRRSRKLRRLPTALP